MKADNEKCFACGRRVVSNRWEYVQVVGEETTVPVGMECYRKIRKFDREHNGHDFYQPPLGGPKLALIGSRG